MTLADVAGWLDVRIGDCRDVLPTLPERSVHCVVTSPPYWGLRDYGVTGQLGMEPTPEEYVANMVAVFREVRRVLRDDGTLWLNLGDSYAAGPMTAREEAGERSGQTLNGRRGHVDNVVSAQRRSLVPPGLKQKDLVGIPWRVAFALQADGWYLRSDIVWSKPNPMPESVTDRPTRSHEYVFLLAKGQWKRRRVELADLSDKRLHLSNDGRPKDADVWAHEFSVRLASSILDGAEGQHDLGLSPLESQVWQQRDTGRSRALVGELPAIERLTSLASRFVQADATAKEFLRELHSFGLDLGERNQLRIGGSAAEMPLPPGIDRYGEGAVAIHDSGQIGEFEFRHGLIVASNVSTCTYYFDQEAVREPHRDTNETRLAALRRHGPIAGEWVPGSAQEGDPHRSQPDHRGLPGVGTTFGRFDPSGRNVRSVWTIATQPYPGAHFAVFPEALVEPCVKAGCPEGGVVLDCFAGSGTVGVVANRLSRRAVLIDLNPEYLSQIERRNLQAPLGLAG